MGFFSSVNKYVTVQTDPVRKPADADKPGKPAEPPAEPREHEDDDDYMDISDVLNDDGVDNVVPMPSDPVPLPESAVYSPKPVVDDSAVEPNVPVKADGEPEYIEYTEEQGAAQPVQQAKRDAGQQPKQQRDGGDKSDALPTREELMAKLRSAVSQMQDSQKRLGAATQQNARLKSDFENYRRRMSDEQERNRLEAVSSVAKKLLPVIDDLERSIDHYSQGTDEQKKFAEGNLNIYKHMLACMAAIGIEQVDPLNEAFDPNYAMAIQQSHADGVEPNIVTMVYQKGYRIGDRVVRTAQVCVSA